MPNLIDSVNHVVVVTGAGFSAPSGLPVYRYGGANRLDVRGEELSHASRYGNHLSELWERWHLLARQARDAQPNAGRTLRWRAGSSCCNAGLRPGR